MAKHKYFPTTHDELSMLCNDEKVNLGEIDVSQITDMSALFSHSDRSDFSGIETWDVSNVTNMSYMFEGSYFNAPINSWDVSNVKDMSRMFRGSPFNQPLDSWDVSRVKNMEAMFASTKFNQPLDSWDVSSVACMNRMFCRNPAFNQPLDAWDMSNVGDTNMMFYMASSFNQPLDSWDVSGVTNMALMFYDAKSFNRALNSWDVSRVENMSNMFCGASSFNQPLDAWDIRRVGTATRMFFGASAFCQRLESWQPVELILFEDMFKKTKMKCFPKWYGTKNIRKIIEKKDGKYLPKTRYELRVLCDDKSVNLGEIDVSKIADMSWMFSWSSRRDFRGIETWDVRHVKKMEGMFFGARWFNRSLDDWSVGKEARYFWMFRRSALRQKPKWYAFDLKD